MRIPSNDGYISCILVTSCCCVYIHYVMCLERPLLGTVLVLYVWGVLYTRD